MAKEERTYCGAIDVGGTKISSALFTESGEISAREKTSIDRSGGAAAAAQVVKALDALHCEAHEAGGRLAAVGVSVPGIVYSTTGEVWAPNIPGWDRYPLRVELERATERWGLVPQVHVPSSRAHVPIVLESDRSAYVSGEAWLGAAAGARDAVFLAVGTGIGAGILSEGRVIHGHDDIAGAVGWFGLDPDFKPAYAEMGCLEAEASGSSVGRKARELLASGRPSVMLELAGGRRENITAETVAAAARRGDPAALEVVAGAVSYLAMGVANIVSILNPEVVVLGGGLFQAADMFFDPVRLEFKKWAQPIAARDVKIALSTLGEDAGLFGCAKLAWEMGKRTEALLP